jgi:hypothetical protein
MSVIKAFKKQTGCPTSAKTIIAAFEENLNGPLLCDSGHYGVPQAAYDIQVCDNLLEQKPEWREQFNQVGEVFPMWKPFIAKWPLLCKLAAGLAKNPTSDFRSRRLIKILDRLYHDGKLAEGWKREKAVCPGTGGWVMEFKKGKPCPKC